MNRFMKNGEVHVAVGSTTELLSLGDEQNQFVTFIISRREEAAGLHQWPDTEWTDLDMIQWLPSTEAGRHLEWLYGTTGEIL